MSSHALHTDRVYEVLDDRQREELRFRSAMITSTALHTGVTLITRETMNEPRMQELLSPDVDRWLQ